MLRTLSRQLVLMLASLASSAALMSLVIAVEGAARQAGDRPVRAAAAKAAVNPVRLAQPYRADCTGAATSCTVAARF